MNLGSQAELGMLKKRLPIRTEWKSSSFSEVYDKCHSENRLSHDGPASRELFPSNRRKSAMSVQPGHSQKPVMRMS
jgi:hypothetical protein